MELTGTNRPKAYFSRCFVCLRSLYGFWITIPQVCGDYSKRETPGSIPNPEAKTLCADGTALLWVWESRSSPLYYSIAPASPGLFLFGEV